MINKICKIACQAMLGEIMTGKNSDAEMNDPAAPHEGYLAGIFVLLEYLRPWTERRGIR